MMIESREKEMSEGGEELRRSSALWEIEWHQASSLWWLAASFWNALSTPLYSLSSLLLLLVHVVFCQTQADRCILLSVLITPYSCLSKHNRSNVNKDVCINSSLPYPPKGVLLNQPSSSPAPSTAGFSCCKKRFGWKSCNKRAGKGRGSKEKSCKLRIDFFVRWIGASE